MPHPKVRPQPGPPPPSGGEGNEPPPDSYRWVMLVLVGLAYFVFGVFLRSVPPLITPILEDIGISYSQMGIILGAWPMAYIAVSIFGGTLIDRWGIRKSILVGIIIMGLSESLRYFANGFGSMFLFVALLGVGAPLISIGGPKTISLWFTGKSRGTALGLYTAAPWIGVILVFSLTNSVVMPFTGYSWRLTFLLFSVLAFIVALLWLLLARESSPSSFRMAESGMGSIAVLSRLIKIRNVRLILAMGFLSFAIIHGFDNWLPKILESRGLSPATAGFTSSIHLFAAIPAILILPRLVPPKLRPGIIALMCLIIATAVVLVVRLPEGFFIAGLLLYGPAIFPISAILMLVMMETPEVGSRYMGAAGGMFYCVAEIGGSAGPYITGVIRNLTGNFQAGVFFIAGLAVIASVVAFSIRIRPAKDTG